MGTADVAREPREDHSKFSGPNAAGDKGQVAEEDLSYIGQMALILSRMARLKNRAFLCYLLEMSAIEATRDERAQDHAKTKSL